MVEIFEQGLPQIPGTVNNENVLVEASADTAVEATVSRRPTLTELHRIADGLLEADPESPYVQQTASSLLRAVELIKTFGHQGSSDAEDLPVDEAVCAQGIQRFLHRATIEEMRASHSAKPAFPYDIFDL